MNKKKIIVFAPHPDDETYGCGGTIAKKISEGYEVIIAIMTDGRNLFQSALGIDNDPTPEEVKEIRRSEVLRATEILGVPNRNLLFLDFTDGKLEEYEEEAEKRITDILIRYSPVEVYFPHEKDCHPDHLVTNRIVGICLQKLGLEPAKYQYSIMHKYARIGPLVEKLLSLFRKSTIKVDISEFFNLKERAVREFKSETSIISSKQRKPLNDPNKKYLKNQETFYI